MTETKVRVFISSPSDVEHERALVKDIIESLAQEYLPYFKVQAVLWEEEALTAAQSFQAGLLRPSECEIVLVMLWTRLGTPLADDPYGGMTGTEWEFVDAVEASARAGSPEVLVYQKTAPRLVDINNAAAIHGAVSERERLETFFREHFFNPDGSFRRAFRQFDSDATLRDLVETQLRKLLHRRISAERRFAAGTLDWHGSPFRSGRPFDVGDERIFTGRETETRDLIARLDRLRGAQSGPLLITGPSGVGKSSLVRAGLIPHLSRPFLFSGLAGCRWCLVDLEDGADPIDALARALAAPAMLGSALASLGLGAEQLDQLLRQAPKVAAGQISAAITHGVSAPRMTGDDSDGWLQLAIVVDPLDPLLKTGGSPPETARAAAEALRALADQEGIWVIATLRSDLINALPSQPALADSLDADRCYRLEPPAPARIRQMLEIPARVAGVEYEDRADGASGGLIDAIERDAGVTPHWPPLLQQTLAQLYQQADGRAGTEGRLLKLRDYRAIGGLGGSVQSRADALWQDLDPEARESMPMLCRALIGLDGGSGARPIQRDGDLAVLTREPRCARLLAALTEARLIVTASTADHAAGYPCPRADLSLASYFKQVIRQTRDEWRARLRLGRAGAPIDDIPDIPAPERAQPDSGGPDWGRYRPTARFAHPVLIDRWPPVHRWIDDPANRRALVLRNQIARQARLWKRTDCNREHLLGEVGFAAAQVFAQAHAAELEPLEQEYLEHSWALIQLRRRRNRWTLGSTLALLILFAGVAAYSFWDARYAARLNAQRNLLHEADIAIDRGNTPKAVQLAWEAGADLPAEATDRIAHALADNRLLALVRPETGTTDHTLAPAFSDDAQALLTFSSAQGAERWQLQADGRFHRAASLGGLGLRLHSLRIAGQGEGRRLLGLGSGGVWTFPVTDEQTPTWPCGTPERFWAALDSSGRFLALSHSADSGEAAVCLIDLTRPGTLDWDRQLPGDSIRDLSLSPDGRRILVASRAGRVLILDRATGATVGTLPREGGFGRPALRALFSPDGRRIAVAALDEQIRIFDPSGRQLKVLGRIQRGKRSVRIHQSSVRALAFSPDGRWLVAGDGTGQVVRWDLETGAAEILGEHDLAVDAIRISPRIDPRLGEHLVLSLSQDKTARLWQLETGRPLAVLSHDVAISDARFSQAGGRVMTAARRDGSARLWSIEPENGLALRLPQDDHVRSVALAASATTADERLLATAAYDGRIDLWRYTPGPAPRMPVKQATLDGHRDKVRQLSFSPSRRWLASASSDGTARVWTLGTDERCRFTVSADANACREPDAADCPDVYQVAFSPNEDWLATASSDARQPVRLWDPVRCAALPAPSPFDAVHGRVRTLALSKTDSGDLLLATGDTDGGIRILRQDPAGRWSALCSLEAHDAAISALSFSPDGHRLAAASRDGRASLIELEAERCSEPRYLDPDAGALYDVQIAPDGDAVVTAAFEAKATLWSIDGEQLAELSGHENRVTSAGFSPDGRWIMTASRDGTIAIWKRPRGAQSSPLAPYLVLDADLGGVTGASFDASGAMLLAGYWENAALLWRLWSQDATPDPELVRHWGSERSQLALIQEAAAYLRELRPSLEPPDDAQTPDDSD